MEHTLLIYKNNSLITNVINFKAINKGKKIRETSTALRDYMVEARLNKSNYI